MGLNKKIQKKAIEFCSYCSCGRGGNDGFGYKVVVGMVASVSDGDWISSYNFTPKSSRKI